MYLTYLSNLFINYYDKNNLKVNSRLKLIIYFIYQYLSVYLSFADILARFCKKKFKFYDLRNFDMVVLL